MKVSSVFYSVQYPTVDQSNSFMFNIQPKLTKFDFGEQRRELQRHIIPVLKIIRKKSRLNREMIWNIWKKSKLKCEMICKVLKKGKLNNEMIWKIWKIYVLVIITPKENSSSSPSLPPSPPAAAAAIALTFHPKHVTNKNK